MITFKKSLIIVKPIKKKKQRVKENNPTGLTYLSETYINFTLGRYEKISPDLDRILNQIKEQPILSIKAKDELLEVTSVTFNLTVYFKGKDIKIDYYDTTR